PPGPGTTHADAVLDGPDRVPGPMRPRPAGATQPSVVRHVHDQPRATLHEVTDEPREDALVTDHDAERGWRAREDAGIGARLEIGNELGPAPDESDHSRQRHEFSEWNEVDLIIPARDPPFGHQKRAVTEPRHRGSISVD